VFEGVVMFFRKRDKETSPIMTSIPAKKTGAAENKTALAESILSSSLSYRFKRDVLKLVASMNQGVKHLDCDVIKRQTMFVQSQLLHSLCHDPSVPNLLKIQLMDYHAKSIRATTGDRRGEASRETSKVSEQKIYSKKFFGDISADS